MSLVPALFLGFLLAFAMSPMRPQEDTPLRQTVSSGLEEQMTFSFEPRAAEQPAWSIMLRANGTGSYAENATPGAAQPLRVDDALCRQLQKAVAAVRGGRCETRQKGIAQTGRKTLTLVPGGQSASASCTFNYSDDEALNTAANDFIALAETFQQGKKLQHDQRFDRLALDADMQFLSAEVASGRALQPGNIATTLRSIADDERVIDRVRREAARLLQAGSDPASAR